MTDYPASLDRMLAAWNEPESSNVRSHLDAALSPEVHFVDPSVDVRGIDGFEENVHEVHARVPGAAYSRTSGVDAHHGFFRYHWAIHKDGELLLPGFDVTEVDDEGRVLKVIGFFGPMPEA